MGIKRLDGKVAIITGATSGIGEAIARLFAKEGAKVVFSARRVEKGKKIEAEIRKAGGNAVFVKADVTKKEDIINLVTETLKLFNQIDILVNNAGLGRDFVFHEMDEVLHFDDIFNLNVKSYFLMSKEVIPHMLEKGKGSIINTASVAAEQGVPMNSSYSASKGAIKQFTRSLALEYAKSGIRVNAVLPGLTTTEQVPAGSKLESILLQAVPMGRAAQPDEIAPGYVYLASDESSFCTGTLLVIDGGITCH
ncbi:MAG: SDR family oxidoreductase [Firmicutes bacterium]|nr:SDR family oxidoreductase [Bacillota bacterium]